VWCVVHLHIFFLDFVLVRRLNTIMSKLINLFFDSDKLEGTKSYKTWKRLIESTLIYNELCCDICNEDTKPIKPTDAATLAKWEIKNAKALALIKYSVNDEMYVHIENTTDAWSDLKIFKDLFDTRPESKKFDLQLKLLQHKLIEGGDVHEYISRLKNIKKEIINVGFQGVDDSFMTTILIVGFPSSYTHFLETLQVTGKLEKLKFDEISEMLSQHDKTFGKKKQVGDIYFSQRPAQVNPQVTVLEAEEEVISFKTKKHIVYKVVVEAKVEETIFQVGAIFKAEETVKEEAIFKAEDKLKTEVKIEAKDRIQAEEEI
jgi:hypothetical protein